MKKYLYYVKKVLDTSELFFEISKMAHEGHRCISVVYNPNECLYVVVFEKEDVLYNNRHHLN